MSRIFQSDILDSSHHWPIGRNEEWLTCLFRTTRQKKVLPILKKHRVLQQFETFRSKQHGTCGVSCCKNYICYLPVSFVFFFSEPPFWTEHFCACIPHGAFKQACEQMPKIHSFQWLLDTDFNKKLSFGNSDIFRTTQPNMLILTPFFAPLSKNTDRIQIRLCSLQRKQDETCKSHAIYKNQLVSSTPITIRVYETSLNMHHEHFRHTTGRNVG